MGWRSLAVVLLYLLIFRAGTAHRIIIKHEANAESSVSERAKSLGLAPVRASPSHGLLVLGNKQHKANKDSKLDVAQLLEQINAWPEVILAEEDQPRYMHRPLTAAAPASAASAAASSSKQQGDPYLDCTSSDTPLSNSTVLPEYQPYGLNLIQAGPNSSKLPSRIDDQGVLICIIDSGLDIGHPDMKNNSVDGCKYEDAFAPAGCPFEFGKDYVSHGTHIAGTIAAQRNGVGVIGVIPGPAEVYVVRVFNDSGDVNQGQGLVYGSTLILAFTQCEGRLSAMQAAYPSKNYRMVVSMSLGAAGPLSIEKMFFREALQRGDIIFVASSGNNGTAETMIQGQLTAAINPGNYPGAYDEVIAIAAVDCAKQLAGFSQKNPSVDLAAPGVNILSLASRDYPLRTGLMAGGFMSENPKIYIPGGIASSENQVRFSGAGKVTANVIDCGTGSAPCPKAKGNICLVQYDPQLQPMENAPAAGSADTGIRGSVFSQMALATFGAEAAPVTGIPEKLVIPGKFYCDAMEFCMKAGAKAVLLGSPAIITGFYGSYSLQEPASFYDLPLLANLDCSELNCTCWSRIGGASKTLPTAGLSLGQYTLVKSAVANATKAGKSFVGTVESQVDAYQRLSGTSMAVPHASGAIARVWAAYPYCNSTTIRTAFEQSALDLGPKGKDVMYGYGLLQAEAAFDYLAKQPCANGWQSADLQQQAALLQGVTSSQASLAVKPVTPGEGVTSSNQAGGGVSPVAQQIANTSKPVTVAPGLPVMVSPAATGATTNPGQPSVPPAVSPAVSAGVVAQVPVTPPAGGTPVQKPVPVQKSAEVTPQPTTSIDVWTITTDGNVVLTTNPPLQPAFGTARQTVASQSPVTPVGRSLVTPVGHSPVTPGSHSPVTPPLASSYVSSDWMPKSTRGLKHLLGRA